MENPIPSEENNTLPVKSTNWLIELGIQSWQAELVLSGIVITGLFQLPELFLCWVDGLMVQSNPLEFSFLRLASIYVLFGIYALILIFGAHLLFRGIWIALLGLNSVFPNGINTEATNGMGKKAWERLKKRYPSLTHYSCELDDNCSLLFSLAAYVSILFISISIAVLIFYKCIQLSIKIVPAIENHIVAIGMGLFVLFMSIILVLQYLGKKYPESQKVNSFSDKFGDTIGYIFSLYFFHKPITYISSILLSNQKSKVYNLIFILISGFSGYFIMGKVMTHNIAKYFQSDRYFTFNNKPNQLLPQNYENLLGENEIVFTPIIQSDIISEKYIKLFIPTIEREIENITRNYPIMRQRLKMTRAQKDSLITKNIVQYRTLNAIFINDVKYENIDYQGYKHPKSDEDGILLYIPTDSCKVGRNILEIRKNYFSKDSIQKIVKIPFMFEGNIK